MGQTVALEAAISLRDLTDNPHLLTHSRFPSPSAGTSLGPGGLSCRASTWLPCASQNVVCHLQSALGVRVSKGQLSEPPEYQICSSLPASCSSSLSSSRRLGSATSASLAPLFCACDPSASGAHGD